MIKTNDLTKVFRTEEVETTALNKVTLHVKEGEYVAVMGPSGCGKSTLLNILGLLDNPTGGSYVFNGTEVANLKERDRTIFRKGNIGFVFQSFNLIDELNVYENVELPLIYLKMKTGERKKRVQDVLDRMKIGHRAKHFPSSSPADSSKELQSPVLLLRIRNLSLPTNRQVTSIQRTVLRSSICLPNSTRRGQQ
jgi:putative ABC transport system ATP-binding protein